MITFSRLGWLGQLGNQLFQVAATLAAAQRYGEEAIFPVWENAQYFAGSFNQSLDIAEIEETYNEVGASYSPIPHKKNLDLFGMFQSEKYFSDCEELIRCNFRLCDDLLPAQWQNVVADCAIHVRRGDYVNQAHIFVPLQMDYYNRAIKTMRERGCKSFLVVTDDIEWCKQRFPEDMTVVEGLDFIQSFCLMSRCKNHIIANSTFSWWSSWLCDNRAKIILAPQTWYSFRYSFRKDDNYQYCQNWELVPHSLGLPQQFKSWYRAKRKTDVIHPLLSRQEWLQSTYDRTAEKRAADRC